MFRKAIALMTAVVLSAMMTVFAVAQSNRPTVTCGDCMYAVWELSLDDFTGARDRIIGCFEKQSDANAFAKAMTEAIPPTRYVNGHWSYSVLRTHCPGQVPPPKDTPPKPPIVVKPPPTIMPGPPTHEDDTPYNGPFRVFLNGSKIVDDFHFINHPYHETETYEEALTWLKANGGNMGGWIKDANGQKVKEL